MLRGNERNKGGKEEQEPYRSHDVTSTEPTLSEIGIEKIQFHRWQLTDFEVPILGKFVGYLVFHETKRSYDIHVTP